MVDRQKIVDKVRALLRMTVANGCTEAEAASAARLAHKLMEEYAIHESEASVEADLYHGNRVTILDHEIGERIWKPADAIATLTATRYWTAKHGEPQEFIAFFGETHAVSIAKYLLAICFHAMTAGKEATEMKHALTPVRVRRHVVSYLDGMADRLFERIREMKPTGTDLVLFKFEIIQRHMKASGHNLGEQKGRESRQFDSYADGRAHADRVNLNAGIAAATPKRLS